MNIKKRNKVALKILLELQNNIGANRWTKEQFIEHSFKLADQYMEKCEKDIRCSKKEDLINAMIE
jgi:hypothetical protein